MRSLALIRAFRRSPIDFVDQLQASGAAAEPVAIATERVLLLDEAADVWTLLTAHARRTVKGRGMDRARVLLGDGLLTSEGDLHQLHRRAVQEAFHPRRIDGYRAAFAAAADRTAAEWTDGAEIDLTAAMSAMTLDAVGAALFAADVRAVAPRVGRALTDLFVGFRLAMAPGGKTLLRSPLPVARRVRRAQHDLDTVVDELLHHRRPLSAAAAGPSVIDLLAARPEFTERAARDEVITLFLAGHETTAMALTWALAAIEQTAGLRGWLEREWDDAGSSTDPAHLPLTTAVLTETLRLWPPSWLFSRRLIESFELGKRRLPAGLMCLISPALLQRDPRWWEAPDEFRPERWLVPDSAGDRFDPKAPGHPRGAYLPFGAGPRMCLGEQFARTEAVTMLATLGRRWRIRVHDAPLEPGPSSMTLRPRGPVRAWVVRRSSAGAPQR